VRPAVPISPAVRQPVVGQSWRYAKRDIFTRKQVDVELDRVAAVGSTIDIDSMIEGGPPAHAARGWGSDWLYTGQFRPAAALPIEIQRPWGMILVDPHWGQLQVYETPIPLWPSQLKLADKHQHQLQDSRQRRGIVLAAEDACERLGDSQRSLRSVQGTSIHQYDQLHLQRRRTQGLPAQGNGVVCA